MRGRDSLQRNICVIVQESYVVTWVMINPIGTNSQLSYAGINRIR